MSDEQLVRAIAGHIDGWRSATFGWQADPDPVKYERNKAAAIEAHAAECLRRIRLALCVEATSEDKWAMLVRTGHLSQEVADASRAVAARLPEVK